MVSRTADRDALLEGAWFSEPVAIPVDSVKGAYVLPLKRDEDGLAVYGLLNVRGSIYTFAQTEEGYLGIFRHPQTVGNLVSGDRRAWKVYKVKARWADEVCVDIEGESSTPNRLTEKAVYIPKDIFKDGKPRFMFRHHHCISLRFSPSGFSVLFSGTTNDSVIYENSPTFSGKPWESADKVTEWVRGALREKPLEDLLQTEEEVEEEEFAIAAMTTNPAYGMF